MPPPLCAFTAGNLAVDALPTVKNAIVAQKGLALETALQPLAAFPLALGGDPQRRVAQHIALARLLEDAAQPVGPYPFAQNRGVPAFAPQVPQKVHVHAEGLRIGAFAFFHPHRAGGQVRQPVLHHRAGGGRVADLPNRVGRAVHSLCDGVRCGKREVVVQVCLHRLPQRGVLPLRQRIHAQPGVFIPRPRLPEGVVHRLFRDDLGVEQEQTARVRVHRLIPRDAVILAVPHEIGPQLHLRIPLAKIGIPAEKRSVRLAVHHDRRAAPQHPGSVRALQPAGDAVRRHVRAENDALSPQACASLSIA